MVVTLCTFVAGMVAGAAALLAVILISYVRFGPHRD
jgi:hypothetical protein